METLGRILVATDGSANGNNAVSFAVALANAYDAKLELCYALEYGRAFEASAKPIVADAVKRAAAAGFDAMSSVLDGSPPEAIAARANVRDVDAIAMRPDDDEIHVVSQRQVEYPLRGFAFGNDARRNSVLRAEAALYDYDPTPMREALEAKTASRVAIETDRALGAAWSVYFSGAFAEAIVSRSHIPVAVVPARRILEDVVVSKAHDRSESSKAAKASALTAASG